MSRSDTTELPLETMETLTEDRPAPPPRALGISLLALVAAAAASFAWPEAIRGQAGLVWVLALVPLSLLSYYKGWSGAALATAATMAALVGTEVLAVPLTGREPDWWMVGGVATVLVAATLGHGFVTELLHRERAAALRLAYRDPLTSLANRRLLRAQGTTAVGLARRRGNRVGVIAVEMVRFRRIADRYSRADADEVLLQASRRIEQALRAEDTAARTGDGEFAVLLPVVNYLEDILAAARRIQARFEEPFPVDDVQFHLEPRLGIAFFPDDSENFRELLDRAVEAAGGRGEQREPGITIFTREARTGGEVAETPEERLRRALDREEFLLHYQPVCRVEDGEPVGAEALVRWQQPDGDLLEASEFLPTAERVGLVERLDRLVIEMAVEQARSWSKAPGAPEWTSVALSAASLGDPDLLAGLRERIDAGELPGEAVHLELRESVALRHSDRALAGLHRLREAGVRVGIDDFGTGHHPLTELLDFPADFVKLELSSVERDDAGEERTRALVDGLAQLVHRLGSTLVVKGVEREEQMAWLRECGCDLAQGYLLGRPAPAEEMTAVRA